MGCTPFSSRNCSVYPRDNYPENSFKLFAPNPNPINWRLVDKYEFKNGSVLIVHYPDCTNFEGKKIMVYSGKYREKEELDPHFQESGGPIARFRPDFDGLKMAINLAKSL